AFKLLTPPTNGDAALRLTLTEIAGCLESIRKFSNSWVIDLPRHLDRHLVTLIDRCTAMLIVFEPTLAGVGAARRWLRTLDQLDYPQERIFLVINRSGSKLRTTENEISNLLSEFKVFHVPNAFDLAQSCTTDGVPAVTSQPRSSYAGAIRKMSAELTSHLKISSKE